SRVFYFCMLPSWCRGTPPQSSGHRPPACLRKGNPRMLVLSRRPNEKLLIPSINTAVQIISIKPGVVRLGIEAPPEVTIYREELLKEASGRLAPAGPEGLVTLSGLRELNQQVGNRL